MSMLLGSECLAQDPGGLVILKILIFSDLTSDLSVLSHYGISHQQF